MNLIMLLHLVLLAVLIHPHTPLTTAIAAAAATSPSTHRFTTAAPLTVHLVPHSHDDVGYEKTLDQYYYGANSTIREAGVQYTLDSIIPTLLADPDRKFIQVEQAFFNMWWNEQSDAVKAQVHTLVLNGQFEFVSGGWCMHDEANTYYIDMIDQMTLGHKFLLDEFSFVPKTGWQIDPFGHSSTNAGLLGAYMGFDASYMCRIDYADKLNRMINKQMEFIWDSSPSLGSKASSIFGATFVGHYGSPPGFCWDSGCDDGADDPIEDDPKLEEENVDSRVDLFLAEVIAESAAFQGNDILITMGGDFLYENAGRNFKEMDKLIQYANQKAGGKVILKYSTPSIYTAAKLATPGLNLNVKTDDFFPYADFPHQYWVGFFTSRPALKRYVRMASAYLQTARQIEILSGLAASSGSGANTGPLRPFLEAVAVAQHHDAVAGTEMQHVAYDYARRIAVGWTQAAALIGTGLGAVISNTSGIQPPQFQTCTLMNQSICDVTQTMVEPVAIVMFNPLAHARQELIRIPVDANNVMVLNSAGEQIPSTLIENSLNRWNDQHYQSRASIIERNTRRLERRVAVELAQRLDPNMDEAVEVEEIEDVPAAYTLVFQAQLQPLGVETYFLQLSDSTASKKVLDQDADEMIVEDELPTESLQPNDFLMSIENDRIILTFSNDTGLLVGYTDKSVLPYVNYSLTQEYLYYQSFFDPTGEQENAGAYISRFMNNNEPIPITPDPNSPVTLVYGEQGPIVWEMHQVFGDWCIQTVRLTLNSSEVEFEYTIGPVPLTDADGVQRGKEVITRFNMDPSTAPPPFSDAVGIDNGGEWYTDSNGREFIQRIRNYRATWNLTQDEPVASNYVPINSVAYMNDCGSTSAEPTVQLTILNDRSQGCASITNTSLELMLHRRLIGDDNKGVHEPLNETASITPYPNPQRIGPGITITGKHVLLLQSTKILPAGATFAQSYRSAQSEIYFPVALNFAPIATDIPTYLATHHTTLQFSAELPPNLELITLTSWDNGTILIRLSHTFSIADDPILSQPVTIDLATIFPTLQVVSFTEWSLTANQPIEDLHQQHAARFEQLQSHAATKLSQTHSHHRHSSHPTTTTSVTITSMQVRTFQLQLAA